VPNIASYLLAGGLVVMAMDFVAPPVGIGLSIGGWPVPEPAVVQSVNRADKVDRLPVPVAGKQLVPGKPSEKILTGCEPAYSPLATAARNNVAGRCVAFIALARQKQV